MCSSFLCERLFIQILPVWSATINFCHELTTQLVWGDHSLYPLIVQGPSYGPISKTFLITLGFIVSESLQHVAFELVSPSLKVFCILYHLLLLCNYILVLQLDYRLHHDSEGGTYVWP